MQHVFQTSSFELCIYMKLAFSEDPVFICTEQFSQIFFLVDILSPSSESKGWLVMLTCFFHSCGGNKLFLGQRVDLN